MKVKSRSGNFITGTIVDQGVIRLREQKANASETLKSLDLSPPYVLLVLLDCRLNLHLSCRIRQHSSEE